MRHIYNKLVDHTKWVEEQACILVRILCCLHDVLCWRTGGYALSVRTIISDQGSTSSFEVILPLKWGHCAVSKTTKASYEFLSEATSCTAGTYRMEGERQKGKVFDIIDSIHHGSQMFYLLSRIQLIFQSITNLKNLIPEACSLCSMTEECHK